MSEADSFKKGDKVIVIEHKLLNPFERRTLLGLEGEVIEISELLGLDNKPLSYKIKFKKGISELPYEVLRVVEKYVD